MVKTILVKCAGLAVDERRTVRDDYVEVVAYTRDMAEWDRRIAEVLGPAVKPTGQRPHSRHEVVTAPYGGIQTGQTLYCKETDSGAEIVMVWPWRDGEHMTLKMAKVGQIPAASSPAQRPRRGIRAVAWVALGGGVLFLAVMATFAAVVWRLKTRLRATVVQNVDPAQVADGVYEGVCDLGLVCARVNVEVQSGRIVTIRVNKHSHWPGYGADAITATVVRAQSLDVDAVAGATGSSTVMLKAIENALRQGLHP